LRVLASGEQVGKGHWVATAVRDVALAAGRFAVVSRTVRATRPVRVTVAVRASGRVPPTTSPFARSGTPLQYLERAARALEVLARLYGPYPWPAFTAVVDRDIAATSGIEYPTLVFLGYRSLLTAVAHETAHQWFYSLVGNDQGRDPWLDEGVATWAQTQVDPAARPYFVNRALPADARNRLGAPIAYWNAHRRSYAAGVYAQGVQALASLGPMARVNCALRRYVERHAYGIATQRDLATQFGAAIPGSRARLQRFGVRG
jgi:aminopeptidase N